MDGGFKSLTYSNKINPQQELCRFELAGGVCNDDKCDMQHFGKIGLAGAYDLSDGVVLSRPMRGHL